MKNALFIIMILGGLGCIIEGTLRIFNHPEEIKTLKTPLSTIKEKETENDPVVKDSNNLYSKPIIENTAVTNENGDILQEPLIKEYYLQLGTFQYEYFAYRLQNKLKEKGYVVRVKVKKINGKEMFINSLGPFQNQTIANNHKKTILQLFPDLKQIPIYSKIKN